MRTLFSVITFLTFVTLGFLPNGFSQEAAPQRMVRLIYFLPNDRPFRLEVVQKMKNEIRNIQAFFGEQMQAHGHGYKTFEIETDAQGEPIVHRVNGKYPDSYYIADSSYWLEVRENFNVVGSKNIYFLVVDNSAKLIQGASGWGGTTYSNGVRVGGTAEVTAEVPFFTAAHELGHAFGLVRHDYRSANIMGSGGRTLSACAADFLSVNPYFNPGIPFEDTSPSIITLISPRTYPIGARRVSVQVKVSDPDGLRQVFLGPDLIACRSLKGEKDVVVEFDYEGTIRRSGSTSLPDSPAHGLFVIAVDMMSNMSLYNFILTENSTLPIATLKKAQTKWAGSVAFSPDGVLLASGSGVSDGSAVILWDVATRRNIATFGRDARAVLSVTFSPDGMLLALIRGRGRGSTIELWDVTTRRNIAILEPIDGAIDIAFSPDGVLLASASGYSDGTVILWDVATRRNIATLKAQTDGAASVAFSPDGVLLASGSLDGTVILWDVATRRTITTFPREGTGGPSIFSLAFSPDGGTLAALQLNSIPSLIRLWNVATRREIDTFRHVSFGSRPMAFSPDGGTLASTGGLDGLVKLWNLASGTELATFPHPVPVTSVSFSPDGTLLASGASDGVRLWDMSPYITPTTPSEFSAWDVNQDGVVNIQDLVWVAAKFGEAGENSADVNGDGVVNILDLVLVAGALGDAAAAPSAYPQALKAFTATDVQQWLIQAQQLSLTDFQSQRGIHFLEHLLAALMPKETALFVNYPNPFNPETWIPYQLSEPADVSIAIYAADAKLVRRLDLGHQAAGIYESRSRAAYWDGRNEVDEPIASGVYFYTLTAGDFTATRKMLILK